MARVNGPAEPRPRQRSPRRGSTPTCSIVVVGSGDPDAIGSCMTRLGDACRRFGAEIIIVVPGSESDVAAIRRTFPFARIVAAPADLRPDELRGLGLQEAGGDIVAFTHDCATHGEEWIGVLERRARNEGGYGPVPNGKMDWARYLADRGLLFGNGRSK